MSNGIESAALPASRQGTGGIQASRDLLAFIQESPSMFHTVQALRSRLDAEGFAYLPESAAWHLRLGGSYYTVRNDSSIIAFKVGADLDAPETQGGLQSSLDDLRGPEYHFQMAAAHADSPTYKVKAAPELAGPGDYLRLNVESYGGVIDATWFDRPLSVAGRVLVDEGDRISSRLVSIDRDLLLIPNVAIHMNHDINKGFAYNRQVDLCPLLSAGELAVGDFDALVAGELGCEPDQILGRDLFLVNRQQPCIWGYANEFVSAPKLDDLQGAFSCLSGFLAADNPDTVSVFACFDNEEVGSGTKQGALSTFLADTLTRINDGLGGNVEDYRRALAKSFLVSCDNAHAVHPNHPEKTDEANRTWLNRGIVIKEAANQKYTTDAFSRAVFSQICRKADVPVQRFANRSDTVGGSTLGNLSNTQVSIHAVDIGLPQLAMHSAYETAGVQDTAWAIRALTAFFDADIRIEDAGEVRIG